MGSGGEIEVYVGIHGDTPVLKEHTSICMQLHCKLCLMHAMLMYVNMKGLTGIYIHQREHINKQTN